MRDSATSGWTAMPPSARRTGACSAPSSSISAAASMAASSSRAIRRRRGRVPRRRARARARAGAHDHALSRRQLRLRLQLGGWRRAGREPSETHGAGVALDRAEHVRHQRVHRLVPAADIEPMLAVNLGTRGPDEAPPASSNTATIRVGTQLSDLRRAARMGETARDQVLVPRQRGRRSLADGQQDRNRVRPRRRGSGQADAADRSDDRACRRAARRAATCRPSAAGRTRCWGTPSITSSYISLHTYLNDYADDTPAFLASPT